MIVLIDTREQTPLTFSHKWVTGIEARKLDVGDYGVEFKDGHVPPIFFERKSISDLFGTMTSGYDRFKKEIKRAQEAKKTLFIIVEGSYYDVLDGYEFSMFEGISMIRKLMTIWVRYGVQTIFVNNREELADYITEFYIAVGKEYVRKNK